MNCELTHWPGSGNHRRPSQSQRARHVWDALPWPTGHTTLAKVTQMQGQGEKMLPLMKRSVQGRKSSIPRRKSSFPRRKSGLADVNLPLVGVNLELDLRLGKLDLRPWTRLFIHESYLSSRNSYFSPYSSIPYPYPNCTAGTVSFIGEQRADRASVPRPLPPRGGVGADE